MNRKLKVSILLIFIASIFASIWYFGLLEYLSPTALQKYRNTLISTVNSDYIPAMLIFIGIYTISVGLSLPGATVLTLSGGLLFGYAGVIYVNIGATAGATGAFLLSRYLFGNSIAKKYEDKLQKFNKELETNGSNYLLTVRFIPLFPFFLINLLSGLTRIKTTTFIWTTSLGIIPGSLFYVYAGMQLNNIEKIDPLSPEFYAVVTVLGILAVIPVVIKKVKSKKQN